MFAFCIHCNETGNPRNDVAYLWAEASFWGYGLLHWLDKQTRLLRHLRHMVTAGLNKSTDVQWQDAGLMCKPLLPFVQHFPPRTFPTSPPGAILCYRFWSDHIIYSSQLFRFKNCLKSKWMALASSESIRLWTQLDEKCHGKHGLSWGSSHNSGQWPFSHPHRCWDQL